MVKMIHISDVHLGATFKSASYGNEFASKRQREIKDTFFNALSYADSNDINYVILSGDIFDTEFMKMSDVKNVFKALGQLKATVLIITGNHDPLKKDSFWNTIQYNDNIHIFEDNLSTIEFPKDDLIVYGYSWNNYYIEDSIFDNIPPLDQSKLNVLIAHGDIYTKRTKYLPINKKNLIEMNFDYVALGHIHQNDFITDRIAYSGSLEPFDFSETGAHGFIEVALDKDNYQATFIPFSKREFKVKTIKVDGSMTEKDIYDAISKIDLKQNKERHMYRIVLEGRYDFQINLDISYLTDIFRDEFLYIEFKTKLKFDFDLQVLKEENKDNIIGKYIDKFQQMDLDIEVNKQAFNIGLEYLLNSKEGTL